MIAHSLSFTSTSSPKELSELLDNFSEDLLDGEGVHLDLSQFPFVSTECISSLFGFLSKHHEVIVSVIAPFGVLFLLFPILTEFRCAPIASKEIGATREAHIQLDQTLSEDSESETDSDLSFQYASQLP